MRYKEEYYFIFEQLKRCAVTLGTDMTGLDRYFGFADGTVEIMVRYGFVPGGEIFNRIRMMTGLYENEQYSMVETVRQIFVMKTPDFIKQADDLNKVLGTLFIDRPSTDKREYVGVCVPDNSMERLHICKGDIVIVARQAFARDGDIVAAEVDGNIVIRRYRAKADIIWLEAAGYVGEFPYIKSQSIHDASPKIRVYGQVVSLARFFPAATRDM